MTSAIDELTKFDKGWEEGMMPFIYHDRDTDIYCAVGVNYLPIK